MFGLVNLKLCQHFQQELLVRIQLSKVMLQLTLYVTNITATDPGLIVNWSRTRINHCRFLVSGSAKYVLSNPDIILPQGFYIFAPR